MLILIAAFSFVIFGLRKDNFERNKKYVDFSDNWYFNKEKVNIKKISL